MSTRTVRATALTLASIGTIAAISTLGMSAANAAPVDQANGPINRMINVNLTNHDLDMTITTGDGSALHQVVHTHDGWCPEADYSGDDVITIRDNGAVVYKAHFTYDGDWREVRVDESSGLRARFHTGNFGGYDFVQ